MDKQKKIKLWIIGGIVVGVIVVASVVSLILLDSNSNSSKISHSNALTNEMKAESSPANTNNDKSPVASISPSTQANKNTDSTSNNNSSTNIDSTSSPKAGDVTYSNAPAIIPTKKVNTSSNKYVQAYYNMFGSSSPYISVLSNKQDNLVKLMTVELLDTLMSMQQLGENTIDGQTSKSVYYSYLETFPTSVQNYPQFISNNMDIFTGKDKQFVTEISTIAQNQLSYAQIEFKVIKQNVSFTNQMIEDLPFGSNLNSAIEQLKSINTQLGAGNQEQLKIFRDSYVNELPTQMLGNLN